MQVGNGEDKADWHWQSRPLGIHPIPLYRMHLIEQEARRDGETQMQMEMEMSHAAGLTQFPTKPTRALKLEARPGQVRYGGK